MSRRRMPLLGLFSDRLNILLTTSASLVSLMLISYPTAAQARNPYSANPKAAKAGEFEFRINCALCHGLGARGGGRGPDLTRAVKKHTHSDAEMFQLISN